MNNKNAGNERALLVVDDDLALGEVLVALLEQGGFRAIHVSSGAAALRALGRGHFDGVITDLRMPGMDGMELLDRTRRDHPDLPVIMLTAHGSVNDAVEAMKLGAAEFLLKPFDREEILYVVGKALAAAGAVSVAGSDMAVPPGAEILGASPAMDEMKGLIARAARTDTTVLIRGESGTGKELVMRSIHGQSPRAAMPLIKVHCAAFPETLIEDELFGHEKGAFSGAITRRQGRIELAHGGTLFLDEVGEIPPPVQVKLLRVLQERELERLGGNDTVAVDVRLVAATHRDLEEMCRAGAFREDLYYRLNVIPLRVPPLRERGNDIELLAHHFCRRLSPPRLAPEVTLDPSAVQRLRAHPWPGNVRELQNLVERLAVLSDGPLITAADVGRELAREPLAPRTTTPSEEPVLQRHESLEQARDAAEVQYLTWVLKRCQGNRSQAARVSGISRRNLYNLLQKHGIDSAI